VLVNDVSAGRGDEAMWPFIAESGVAYVLMHNQGTGIAQPQQRVGSSPLRVWQELAARVAEASAAGIDRTRLVVDPGFGFGKDPDLNWQLVGNDPAAMAEEAGIGGYPILFGVSRKRFLAARPDGRLREEDSMEQRDRLTVALTEQAVRGGVWCVRVHDVAPNAEVVRRLRPDGWMAP
jgi:dihydropteroate synthase